jgi:hypothetical protein
VGELEGRWRMAEVQLGEVIGKPGEHAMRI